MRYQQKKFENSTPEFEFKTNKLLQWSVNHIKNYIYIILTVAIGLRLMSLHNINGIFMSYFIKTGGFLAVISGVALGTMNFKEFLENLGRFRRQKYTNSTQKYVPKSWRQNIVHLTRFWLIPSAALLFYSALFFPFASLVFIIKGEPLFNEGASSPHEASSVAPGVQPTQPSRVPTEVSHSVTHNLPYGAAGINHTKN